jgi:alpha-L-fucosidase 2
MSKLQHRHFQIDGNFGVVSGITEMLMQSQDNEILVLPALPKAWSKGNIKGIVARGGFEIDIEWGEGKLTKLIVKSLLGNNARIRYRSLTREYKMEKGEVLNLNNKLNEL